MAATAATIGRHWPGDHHRPALAGRRVGALLDPLGERASHTQRGLRAWS
jgi:hypothetical protein